MRSVFRRVGAFALPALLLALAVAGCREGDGAGSAPALTIGAAASLRNVLPALGARWEEKGGAPVSASYGASGSLRRQVEAGAPMAAVVFAAAAPVHALEEKGLLAGEPIRIATNRLVLIGPAGAAPSSTTFASLPALPAAERIAIGEPGAVPAGQYAREALRALGIWEALQDRLVYGGDVGAVLAYTRRGEVAAAIVYATEAASVEDVVILDEAAGPWAPRPEVVAAVLKGPDAAHARAFLAFLASDEARAILRDAGFGPP